LRLEIMTRNRFEQVDEIQPDAVTLVLKRESDGETGLIVFPVSAYRGAIHLANDMKVAIVVCDPDAVWNKDWGDLYRPVD
jgi:hypothetical protein